MSQVTIGDEFDKHKQSIRDEGQRVTPFRLGMKVGESGETLPCPYTTPKSRELYEDGIVCGKRHAAAKGDQA